MIILTFSIICVSILLYWLRKSPCNKWVCILVLGDIGRSPRMQYHAISFSDHGYNVNILGYKGSKPDNEVLERKNINVQYIWETPKWCANLPKLVNYGVKAAFLFLSLIMRLIIIPKPKHVLVQNPPSIPTLFVVWIICKLRGCCFVIDWHNYGFTILSLALGERHTFVKISRKYEHYLGKKADFNICVTNAMKEDLKNNWHVKAITHYDRPPLKFRTITTDEKHRLFMKLCKTYDMFKAQTKNCESDVERTMFTVKQKNGKIHVLPSRPALIVSSTSWTEDEDFSILLNALEKYESICDQSSHERITCQNLPKIACVITGKGPMKEHYLSLIKQKCWKHITFCTPWLEPEDYPVLLASCDLGICLHTSSSGLDLPMKVVDMFGCGLPVCAVSFKCLPELVKHNENGMVFHCANELSQQLVELLDDFPTGCHKLQMLGKNLASFQNLRWAETWKQNVLPIFSD